MKSSEELFAARLREQLLNEENCIDDATRQQLAAARARAIAQVRLPAAAMRGGNTSTENRWFQAITWRWVVPSGAVAALALMAVIKFGAPNGAGMGLLNGPMNHFNSPAEVAELLGVDPEVAAMNDDPDFYQWLSDMDGTS